MLIEHALYIILACAACATLGFFLRLRTTGKKVEIAADTPSVQEGIKPKYSKTNLDLSRTGPGPTIAKAEILVNAEERKRPIDFETVEYQSISLLQQIKDKKITFNKPIVYIGVFLEWGIFYLGIGSIIFFNIRDFWNSLLFAAIWLLVGAILWGLLFSKPKAWEPKIQKNKKDT